jgi:hypothetical protein
LKPLLLIATFLIPIFGPTVEYLVFGQEEDEDADEKGLNFPPPWPF